MVQLKFISREKLVEYIDEELRDFLNEHGIYDISQYGWAEDEEHDQEYIGHALWQENPPQLKKLVNLGNEFTNLMKSARHSLGLTCLYRDTTDTLLNDSGYSFSFHLADTIHKLNQASDRIREFLVDTFSQCGSAREKWPPVGKVIQGGKAYDAFRSPFLQIRDEVAAWSTAAPSLCKCLTTLIPLAEEVARNRSANQAPFQHLEVIHNWITSAAANQAMGYPDDALEDDLTETWTHSSHDLLKWYEALVKLSSQVFMSEHLLRRLTRQSGTEQSRARKHGAS